jgi:acyl-CoA reductase-like NAD-dependent aldehyde dehydrogenase
LGAQRVSIECRYPLFLQSAAFNFHLQAIYYSIIYPEFDYDKFCGELKMLKSRYPFYLGSKPVLNGADLPVTNKYTGEIVSTVTKADRNAIEKAIELAVSAAKPMKELPSYKKQEILYQVIDRITKRKDELAQVLAIEAGKPIRDSHGEITRLIDTFRIAAEEAVRIYGELMPLDISARVEGYQALLKRFPVGVCSFITPFNFPMNLAAHKIAPAIAAGCPFVLKPASATPISSIILGEIMAETALPEGAFSILPCSHRDAEPMITDERIKHLSFTGSPDVGWDIKARCGKKTITLELGGNAACIVDAGADIEYAVKRLIMGAFYQSGQSCISVQRIIAHEKIYDKLKSRLAEEASKLKYGDPLLEDTFLGPLITLDDAKRVESWVNEAVAAGAKVVTGGKRHDACYEATILEDVRHDLKVSCVEVFGPVTTIEPFSDFKRAIEIANDSQYGLQAGVFTDNLDRAFYAYNDLEVGGVVINDVPSFRVDNMPYGGVKNSGIGREGVRFAIEAMTELKLMVMNNFGKKI